MFPSSWKLFMPSQSEDMLYWAVTEYITDHHSHYLYIPSCHIQKASSSLEPYWTSSSLSLIRASWEQTYHLHKPFLFFILPPNYSPVAYQRSGVMVLVGGLFTMVHGKGKSLVFVTNKESSKAAIFVTITQEWNPSPHCNLWQTQTEEHSKAMFFSPHSTF